MMHTEPWPWSLPVARRADFVRGLRSVLEQAEGLEVAGWETSCRLAPSGLRPDRLLLGFSPVGVAPRRLQALPAALGMPTALAVAFAAAQGRATHILLALELDHTDLEIKAYLSFGSRFGRVGSTLEADLLPAMRGYKWHPSDPIRTRTSDYCRLPVAARQLQTTLEQADGVPPAVVPAYGVAAFAVREALARRPYWYECDFLQVTEQGSERSSCCVRLYESGLKVVDLQPAIEALQKTWLLSDAQHCIERMGQRPLGWMAVGVDRQREPFVTLYCEATRADARQALSFGTD
ncbi:MAG: hypothetical protein HQL87_08340 [Magnetococcales bacterium]|nr:hypothetical protein [Magnetococcales bacterium]